MRFFKLFSISNMGYLIAFSLLYYAAVVIGLESRIGNIALIWPANGVAFCFFILRPKSEWPVYTAALSLGYIAGMYATNDYPWLIIFGVLLANIIQTVVGAWLVKRYVPAPINFSSIREIVVTLLCTAIIGSLASAFFTVTVLGAGFMETPWQLWASGLIDNAGSTIVTLPLLLVLINTFSPSKWKTAGWQRWIEAVALCLITIVLTENVYSASNQTDALMRTLPYLLVPCILWAGLRFGQQGVTLGVLFITIETIRHTIIREGPFATNDSGFILVLTVHLYLGVIAMTGLIVAALMKQQKIAMQSLAGGIAHEMRNPLGRIRYSLNTVRNAVLDAPSSKLPVPMEVSIRDAVDDANQAVNHSLQVIDFTLDSIHEKKIDRATFDYLSAKQSVKKAIEGYNFESPTERNKVSINLTHDFMFQGDETLFTHVLFNLLKNALHYLSNSPSGNVSITIEMGQKLNRIVVRDNGPGISPSILGHLFDNFFTVGKKGGTGLGLAYCRHVMRAFSGDIYCESTEGEYTAFILIFPTVSSLEITRHQQKLLMPLENKHILIVDDNTEFIRQLLASLPSNMLITTLFNDAQLAVLDMKKHAYDLVVMDLNLSGIGGLKSIRWIRNRSIFSEGECLNSETIPIMVFSSEPEPAAKEKSLAAGATSFLHKDCHSIDFIKGLLSCIEQAKIENFSFESLRGSRILVVDDEKINRSLYKSMLEPHGVNVCEATDGEMALTLLKNSSYDAIITDLHMPGISGWQLTKNIRADETQQGVRNFIPIIAISGDPRQNIETNNITSGINTLLKKPIEQSLLLNTLIVQLKHSAPKYTENKEEFSQSSTIATNEKNNQISEALAKLLHDMMKPILTLEVYIELLETYVPELIHCYHDVRLEMKNRGNFTEPYFSENAIANIQLAPKEMAYAVHASRQKQEILRSKYEQIQDSELIEQLVKDVALHWRWIDTIQRTSLSPTLPSLLTNYKKTHSVISKDNWERLNRFLPDCIQSIMLIQKILKTYENSVEGVP